MYKILTKKRKSKCRITNNTFKNMLSEKIDYIIMLVQLCADHFGLAFLEAYRYISKHGGVEYAERHYNILHTLSFDEQVEGLAMFCHSKGGELL